MNGPDELSGVRAWLDRARSVEAPRDERHLGFVADFSYIDGPFEWAEAALSETEDGWIEAARGAARSCGFSFAAREPRPARAALVIPVRLFRPDPEGISEIEGDLELTALENSRCRLSMSCRYRTAISPSQTPIEWMKAQRSIELALREILKAIGRLLSPVAEES